jgi:beta-phosphoglucomutase family hydrolase
MPAVEALIFDCDGTLVESMPTHYLAWKAVLEPYGIQFPEDRFYALGGVPVRDIVERLGRENNISLDPDQVAREKEDHYYGLMETIKPRQAIVEVARRHRGVLPMAVASGSSRKSVEKSLSHIGILDWFDAVVCAQDVEQPKPAPDIFLLAAEKLGVDPKTCRVYEDSDLGLEAGRRAGMKTVDVRD